MDIFTVELASSSPKIITIHLDLDASDSDTSERALDVGSQDADYALR